MWGSGVFKSGAMNDARLQPMLGKDWSEDVKLAGTDSWTESVGEAAEVAHPRTLKEADAAYGAIAERHGINRRRLALKVDLCIMPPICLLYVLAFLDRLNISNANVYGMSKDIHLVGNQYNVALAVFFVPYVVFEIPANWLLKKLSPHVFLSVCLLCFGGITIGQGFVRNYHELIVTRVLLGTLETAMFPSCFYLLGSWYTRDEAQKRYTFFFSSTALAGAFGGLIAYGMHTLDMKRGIEGWRWIFIVEGAITAFCGLALFFCIADFPEQARFLSDRERAYMTEKLVVDQGESGFEHQPTLRDIAKVFRDWKTWCSAFMYFGLVVGIYGYAYFSIAIINTFGFSPISTQVHSIYPWITTFGGNVLLACFSDFARHRYLFSLFGSLLAIVGLAMLLGTEPITENRHVRYGACFLVCIGVYGAAPLVVCWASMNFSGHTRKMVSTAFQIGFGNIGGIIATFVFLDKDKPAYARGLWTALGLVIFSIASSLVYLIGVMKINRDRAQGRRSRLDCGRDLDWDNLDEAEKAAAGDLNPDFRYMY